MKRRALLVLLGLIAIGGGAAVYWFTIRSVPPGRINVLIISLDTVRADRMGFNGYRLPDGSSPTPNLDKLAKRCAAMTEAVTPAPLTLPAHASLLTGLYPDRHGLRENDSFRMPGPDGRRFSLLAEDLSAEGYHCAAFVSGQPLEERYGLAPGFSHYEDTGAQQNPVGRLTFRELPAKHTVGRAIAHLERVTDEDRPFFFFVHLFDAHDPYDWHGPHGQLDPGKRVDRYMSEIIHVDAQVGRLLKALPDDGRNTLIIVVADHGEGLGDHGEHTHGFTLHQSTLRVPFLLRAPEGVDVSNLSASGPPARLVDVYPTVLAVTAVPMNEVVERDGRNLLEPPPEDWHAFAETLYPYYQFGYAHQRCCQDRDRKVITGGTKADELFAWRTDRAEEDDLAPGEPKRVRGLRAWINRHVARPGRAAAIDVNVQQGASVPYMGGRTVGTPVEPTSSGNLKLPAAQDRWKVIKALDDARRYLRPETMDPKEASLALSAFKEERDQNPALLWWSARAVQMQGRDEKVGTQTRLLYLNEAGTLYARHLSRFKDPRAFDAGLGILFDIYDLTGERKPLLSIVKRATGELALATGAPGREKRSRTLLLRGRAREALGELEAALDDYREARRREADPGRKQRLTGKIEVLKRTRRQSGLGK
ncbi:MAG: hypothetical protein CL908_11835 [Deltaproteobacteria bacterium]|nr:hypothetical protein [Deltaproteobacteria bacterium]